MSLFILLLSPFLIGFANQKSRFFRSILEVLSGKKTWVGYCSGNQNHLPSLKKGILSPASIYPENIPEKKKDELNIVYAKNYHLLNDLEIVAKAWKNIGKS
jgi:lipopolysaccharide/colanic/teichoic acid biosynthesis glycosyltransferase